MYGALTYTICSNVNIGVKRGVRTSGMQPTILDTIMPEVTDITGLDNYKLTDQTRFDANTGDLLNNFLARLPSPVCLVAHNGNATKGRNGKSKHSLGF